MLFMWWVVCFWMGGMGGRVWMGVFLFFVMVDVFVFWCRVDGGYE
jgi:hypothetical protein